MVWSVEESKRRGCSELKKRRRLALLAAGWAKGQRPIRPPFGRSRARGVLFCCVPFCLAAAVYLLARIFDRNEMGRAPIHTAVRRSVRTCGAFVVVCFAQTSRELLPVGRFGPSVGPPRGPKEKHMVRSRPPGSNEVAAAQKRSDCPNRPRPRVSLGRPARRTNGRAYPRVVEDFARYGPKPNGRWVDRDRERGRGGFCFSLAPGDRSVMSPNAEPNSSMTSFWASPHFLFPHRFPPDSSSTAPNDLSDHWAVETYGPCSRLRPRAAPAAELLLGRSIFFFGTIRSARCH